MIAEPIYTSGASIWVLVSSSVTNDWPFMGQCLMKLTPVIGQMEQRKWR